MRAKRSPVSALLLSAAMLGFAACERARTTRAEASFVATVNGKPITQQQFDRFLTVKLGVFSREQLSDTVRSQLLDELLKREVALQAAQLEGLALQTPCEGTADADCVIRAEQESDLLVRKYYQDVILKDISVTHDEVISYYNEHRSSYQVPDGFYVREMCLPSRAEAERLRTQVAEGKANFADVARESSKTPTAGQGGLAYYDAEVVPPFLKNAVDPLQEGQLSDVVKSNYGYHVFLLERRSAPSLDRVQERVTRDLMSRKNEEVVEATVNRLLDQASVTVNRERLRFHYEGRFQPRK